MQLYILRHGNAETYARTDFDRALKSCGEKDVHCVANHFLKGLAFDRVLVSPYQRARQTATIAWNYVQKSAGTITAGPVTCEHITPEGNVGDFCDYLYSLHLKSVLIVSHQTFVGRLIEFLTNSFDGHGMGTSHLAALEVITPAKSLAELLWIEGPKSDHRVS